MDSVVNGAMGLEERISDRKKEILELLDSGSMTDNDFVHLVKMKDVPDELHETLILLHSNYKTQLQTMRSSYTKAFIAVTDDDREFLNLLKDFIDKVIEMDLDKNSLWKTILKPKFLTFAAVLLFVLITAMYVMLLEASTRYPDAARGVADVIKSGFGSNSSNATTPPASN